MTVDIPQDTSAVTQMGVRQIDVTTVGLRLDRGVSLGYVRDRLLSLPFDCRMVVFIRSTSELAHAERVLRAATKEELCIANLAE